MSRILQPNKPSTEQQRLVLGGMGGIGKTQLAIGYARRHQSCYTSVFWLNATSQLTLHASIRQVAQLLLQAADAGRLDDKQVLVRVLRWLSDRRNTQWLLIFDNYDEPDQYEMNDYCPYAAHGSIIITTRLPDLVTGQQVRVQPLSDIEESLDILQTRSQRDNIRDGKAEYAVRDVKHQLLISMFRSGCSTSGRATGRSATGPGHSRSISPQKHLHFSSVPAGV